MTTFYDLLDKIRTHFEESPFINTVTYGDILRVELDKNEIYPLSHFNVDSANYQGNLINFQMSIILMDLVDFNKDIAEDKFKRNNNEHDVLNTLLAVGSRFLKQLEKGDFYLDGYQLEGSPSLEPFVDRFENEVTGWTITFNILVKNDISLC